MQLLKYVWKKPLWSLSRQPLLVDVELVILFSRDESPSGMDPKPGKSWALSTRTFPSL